MRRMIAEHAKDEADLRRLAERAAKALAVAEARLVQQEAHDNAEADRILTERGLPPFTLRPLAIGRPNIFD